MIYQTTKEQIQKDLAFKFSLDSSVKSIVNISLIIYLVYSLETQAIITILISLLALKIFLKRLLAKFLLTQFIEISEDTIFIENHSNKDNMFKEHFFENFDTAYIDGHNMHMILYDLEEDDIGNHTFSLKGFPNKEDILNRINERIDFCNKVRTLKSSYKLYE